MFSRTRIHIHTIWAAKVRISEQNTKQKEKFFYFCLFFRTKVISTKSKLQKHFYIFFEKNKISLPHYQISVSGLGIYISGPEILFSHLATEKHPLCKKQKGVPP